MEENLFIYVLRLENNKYYVGKTKDLLKRLDSHKNGSASNWTKKYKPIFVERVIERASIFDEDKYTKEYMNKYGIDNVRGGAYVMEILSDDQINLLLREITAANDCCIKCGMKGHFISNCKNKTNSLNINNINHNTNNINHNHNTNNINSNNINYTNTNNINTPIINSINTNSNNINIPIINSINTNSNNINNPIINTTDVNNIKQNNNSIIKNSNTKNIQKSKKQFKNPELSNKGKKWSIDEDNNLYRSYKSGMTISDLAQKHQRTEYAIKVRLKKLGQID